MSVSDFYGQTAAVVTSHTGTVSSSILLPSNGNRINVLFYNHSSAALFLKFGDGASVTSFSVKIGSGSYYETTQPAHTGSITGAWDVSGGSVFITEFGKS